jgi:hypothetical protein
MNLTGLFDIYVYASDIINQMPTYAILFLSRNVQLSPLVRERRPKWKCQSTNCSLQLYKHSSWTPLSSLLPDRYWGSKDANSQSRVSTLLAGIARSRETQLKRLSVNAGLNSLPLDSLLRYLRLENSMWVLSVLPSQIILTTLIDFN